MGVRRQRPQARKVFNVFIKQLNCTIRKLRDFLKLDESFRKFFQKQENKQNFLSWLGGSGGGEALPRR